MRRCVCVHDACACADVCVCADGVCARLSPRAPSAPSAWEPGHPAAASALGAQTLAPALRNVLLGGRAGSRRGQGVFIHHEPAVRKGLRTPHDEGDCWGLRASPRATDPWVMTQRIKQIPQGRADPSKYTRGRRDALPAGARKCVQWGGSVPNLKCGHTVTSFQSMVRKGRKSHFPEETPTAPRPTRSASQRRVRGQCPLHPRLLPRPPRAGRPRTAGTVPQDREPRQSRSSARSKAHRGLCPL